MLFLEKITDGIILPHLKTNLTNDSCGFLDENGRCRIHSFRPGICRLFPLGRIYEKRSFHYFLQANECLKENRTKVKIRKWIGYPDFAKYETFINDWHYLLKDLSTELSSYKDAEQIRTIQMMLLKLFFVNPYDKTRDFYEQFYERMAKIR